MVIYDEIHNTPVLPWEPDLWDEGTALTTFLSYSKCCLWALSPWNSAQHTQLCLVNTGGELFKLFGFFTGSGIFYFLFFEETSWDRQRNNWMCSACEWFLLIIHNRQSRWTTNAKIPALPMITQRHPAWERAWNKVFFLISTLTQDILLGEKIIIYLHCCFVLLFCFVFSFWFVLGFSCCFPGFSFHTSSYH